MQLLSMTAMAKKVGIPITTFRFYAVHDPHFPKPTEIKNNGLGIIRLYDANLTEEIVRYAQERQEIREKFSRKWR